MKILHYTLGLPPYRSGGLTKYATDLMIGQIELGYDISLLYPGSIYLLSKSIRIIQGEDFQGIKIYELINPLPVSLQDGIKDTNKYTQQGDVQAYIKFLIKISPNVIHVHTLMGLHKEFFEAAKKLSIKICFTAHDYFGLCPSVNMFYDSTVCDQMGEKCVLCNKGALAYWKVILLQSKYYRALKDIKIIKRARVIHKKDFVKKNVNERGKKINIKSNEINKNIKKYLILQDFYKDIISFIDKIHYTSNLSKSVFINNGVNTVSEIIPIIHKDIKDSRRLRRYEGELKVTYVGDIMPYKGYEMLQKALDEIYNDGYTRFKLNTYFKPHIIKNYMVLHEKYRYENIGEMFDITDVLIVPSIWKETYGLVVLEAASYGVPVIVTKNVGAKDLIIKNDQFGWIVETSVNELKGIIMDIYLNRKKLMAKNIKIVNMNWNFNYRNHIKAISEFYKD